MNIVLITQNEYMYLPQTIDYFLRRVPEDCNIVAAVVFDASPYGKKMSAVKKAVSAIKIFGLVFFIRYGIKLLLTRLSGRDVRSVLARADIPLIEVKGSINSPETISVLTALHPDLFISIAGNQIFKKALLAVPKVGTLNLHTALLPKYRGLMPSFWVLKNAELETGVSVFFVDEGIDSGPILVQKRLKLGNISQGKLIEMTKILGVEAVIDGLERIASGNFVTIENDDNDSSYYSFPSRSDVLEFKAVGNRFY